MRKTKTERAITLVALIITIVVLLVLATVAINSVVNDGIISHAGNATNKYNESVANEQNMLGEYLNYLNPSNGGGSGLGDATVGTKVTSLSTINGQAYNENNPVIPAGFIAINTTASSWDGADLAAEVKKGLVITDSVDGNGVSNGNEFVWIPVPTLDAFARLKDGSTENYRGVLYNFKTDGTVTERGWTSTEIYYIEPANLTDSTNGYDDNAGRFTTGIKDEWDENYYQEAFNKMVESVTKYKGFYVGRYEMSINSTSGKAESVAGATSATASADSANMWWGLYEKATTYSQSGVISEMIWGCQYDAMMKWMKSNNIDVTSTTPTDTNRNVVASKNTTRVTGSVDSNDILNNIYDILGNSNEWTQEANGTFYRITRGGYFTPYVDYNPSTRNDGGRKPTENHGNFGSRLSLYVEL